VDPRTGGDDTQPDAEAETGASEPDTAPGEPEGGTGSSDEQNSEVADRLTERDGQDSSRRGSYAKVYTANCRAGQNYAIQLESPSGGEWFDPVLRVEDEQGRVLAEDNDSDGRMNARVVFRSDKDQVCRIVVTSFRPRATGVFFLKVR
jgi:hypothetical protein